MPQRHCPPLPVLKSALGLRVFLSKLRMHEDAKYDGSKFNHFINHGFVAAEREQLQAFLAEPSAKSMFDGFVMRCVRDDAPAEVIAATRALAASLGVELALQVRLAGDNPAEPLFDDLATANRVAEAVVAAMAGPPMEIFFDSFVDVDRGYFPHAAFVDRRYDPRLASHVLRHLHAALGEHCGKLTLGRSATNAQGRWLEASAGADAWLLCLPRLPIGFNELAVPPELGAVRNFKARIDLGRGVTCPSEERAGASADTVSVPTLFQRD